VASDLVVEYPRVCFFTESFDPWYRVVQKNQDVEFC